MSDCSIKLEDGKTYVSRDGNVFGPVKNVNDGSDYPFETYDPFHCWQADGRYLVSHAHKMDLMREYVEPSSAADPVNNPSHYASGAVECIDAIQASMSVEAFKGYLRGNCVKYLWRFEHKGGVEDLRKAEWYLKRLLATFDADA